MTINSSTATFIARGILEHAEKAQTPDIPAWCGENAIREICSYVVVSYRARPTPHGNCLSEGPSPVSDNTQLRVDIRSSIAISSTRRATQSHPTVGVAVFGPKRPWAIELLM